MHIELWQIDRPKPYPKNARKWSAAAVAKVASSVREYGFRQPIVVDVHDVICIGHLRLAAAKITRPERSPRPRRPRSDVRADPRPAPR